MHETFQALCRSLRFGETVVSPRFQTMVSGRDGTRKDGIAAFYSFPGFRMELLFAQRGMYAPAGAVLWLRFFFPGEPLLPVPLYDLLAVLRPGDFRRYTFSGVTSKELLTACFGVLRPFLSGLVPEIAAFSFDTARRTALLSARKERICAYCGGDVFAGETGEDNALAEKIRNKMLDGFETFEIDRFFCGAYRSFLLHDGERARKRLLRDKYRSAYEDALLSFLGTPAAAGYEPETVPGFEGKARKQEKRTSRKEAKQLLLPTLALWLPIALLLCAVSYLLTKVLFPAASLVLIGEWGILGAMLPAPIVAVALSGVLQPRLQKRREKKLKEKRKGEANAAPVPASPGEKRVTAWLLVAVECASAFFCVAAANTALTLYETGFGYAASAFTVVQTKVPYSEIKAVWETEGYLEGAAGTARRFQEDRHLVIQLKSGEKVDCYDATSGSMGRAGIEEALTVFRNQGVSIREARTNEDIPEA